MSLYKWKELNNGMQVESWQGTESRVQVPDRAEGRPVVELGRYSFRNCRGLEEIWLPDSVEILGSHCFYDCRNLHTIHLSDRVRETADGSFKNCRKLSRIELRCLQGKMTVLKNIFEECDQKLHVVLHKEGQEVHLLFPAYVYDYQENTQARMIHQVTYGAGVHYRQCITENGVDYDNYDGRFALMAAVEQEETAGEAAVLRLAYPVHLEEKYRQQYEIFLVENYQMLIELWIREERQELLQYMLDCSILGAEGLKKMLVTAQRQSAVSIISWLLEYKKAHNHMQELDEFDL